jgi:hypothetical protein
MTSDDLKQKFDNDWGAFRRFIALHPLTGVWIGVAAGAVVVAPILHIIF